MNVRRLVLFFVLLSPVLLRAEENTPNRFKGSDSQHLSGLEYVNFLNLRNSFYVIKVCRSLRFRKDNICILYILLWLLVET